MRNEKQNRSGGRNIQEDLQTLARGLHILDAFNEKEEFGISDLARRLGLPKSAVHRVMSTRARGRFVEQTAARRYRLGLKVLELGSLCAGYAWIWPHGRSPSWKT